MCAIGFAVGMERLLSLVPYKEKRESFVYFVWLGNEAKRAGMELALLLRREGIECLIEYKDRSLRNQMSRADKLGAPWVLIVGEDEVRKGTFQIKRMDTGEQKECRQEEILQIMRESAQK